MCAVDWTIALSVVQLTARTGAHSKARAWQTFTRRTPRNVSIPTRRQGPAGHRAGSGADGDRRLADGERGRRARDWPGCARVPPRGPRATEHDHRALIPSAALRPSPRAGEGPVFPRARGEGARIMSDMAMPHRERCRAASLAAWAGVACPPAVAAVLLAAGWLSPSYDPVRTTIS